MRKLVIFANDDTALTENCEIASNAGQAEQFPLSDEEWEEVQARRGELEVQRDKNGRVKGIHLGGKAVNVKAKRGKSL